MRVGSKHQKTAIKIVESKPIETLMFDMPTGVIIDFDSVNFSEKPDVPGIEAVLNNIKNKSKIKLYEITYDSNLTEIPCIEKFQNIEHLHLAGRKIKDFSQIAQLKKIKSVFLCNYKHENLENINHAKLNYFRAIRGRIETFELSAKAVFLQDCRNFIEFSQSEIEFLTIECCQNLNLNSLRKISGLKHLSLLSRRNLPDFNFLNLLKHLTSFSLTANPLTKSDISYLYETKIPAIFLGVKDSLIKEIGLINKGITITNGDLTFQNGEEQPDNSEYYRLAHPYL